MTTDLTQQHLENSIKSCHELIGDQHELMIEHQRGLIGHLKRKLVVKESNLKSLDQDKKDLERSNNMVIGNLREELKMRRAEVKDLEVNLEFEKNRGS